MKLELLQQSANRSQIDEDKIIDIVINSFPNSQDITFVIKSVKFPKKQQPKTTQDITITYSFDTALETINVISAENSMNIHNTTFSSHTEEYTYDPFGQRIKIMRNDSAKTIIYTPFKELMQIRNTSGIFNFTYVYQDDVLVARVDPKNNKTFYHPDHLGSTVLITNASGRIVENTFYSPFGEVLGGGKSDVKLYTGQFKDLSCEYYYGARYYNPCIGQFIQPDTLIQQVYNPQNLNHYSYTWNNPYRYKDTSGNYIETALDIGFILWDFRDIRQDPTNPWNYVSLGADIIGLAVPGVTGGRVVVKSAEAGVKTFSSAEKVVDIVKTEQKIQDVANKLEKVTDPVSGTKKHTEAFRQLKGTENVQVDIFIKDQTVVTRNTRGSTGVDVIITPQDLSRTGIKVDTSQIKGVYDFKFGTKTADIPTGQLNRIIKETGFPNPQAINPQPSFWSNIGNLWNNLWK